VAISIAHSWCGGAHGRPQMVLAYLVALGVSGSGGCLAAVIEQVTIGFSIISAALSDNIATPNRLSNIKARR